MVAENDTLWPMDQSRGFSGKQAENKKGDAEKRSVLSRENLLNWGVIV